MNLCSAEAGVGGGGGETQRFPYLLFFPSVFVIGSKANFLGFSVQQADPEIYLRIFVVKHITICFTKK